MASVQDSYSETNQDGQTTLQDNHPSDITLQSSAAGQAFTAGATYYMPTVKFYMKKSASPTGTGYARLYAATGTVGSSGLPTGSALASSAGLDVSTLDTNYALITLDFSGDLYELQNGTDYCVVFEAPASGTIDLTNYINVGRDNAADPGHAGNAFYFRNGAWTAQAAEDICFYVYGELTLSISVHDCSDLEEKVGG